MRPHFKIAAGPLLALLLILFADLVPGSPTVTYMAGITVWIAVWWFTEAVHVAVTALLPLILFPVFGILNGAETSKQYMDSVIFLFIGGFIIAFALERWNLHERIALRILRITGTSSARILLGVMLSSFLISMWISNTATVMMLISAVLAVVYKIETHSPNKAHANKLSTGLLIALAYSATIGGMATIIGTPTNMIFVREYKELYGASDQISFFGWFVFAFPLALIFLIITYFILKKTFVKGKENEMDVEPDYFVKLYREMGRVTFEQKVVMGVFLTTAVLWFTRADIDLGIYTIPGWSNLFKNKDYFNDSTVALLASVVLFLIPSKNEPGKKLINWEEASKIPFDIVLLFGGGFALAKGIEVSGLSEWMASQLKFVSTAGLPLFILVMCIVITIISEFASNVACIQLMIPVLVAVQKNMDVSPLMLLIPATLAASLGFMLPVATAPNTIVFGTKRIMVKHMLRAGFWVNVTGIILFTLFTILFSDFLK